MSSGILARALGHDPIKTDSDTLLKQCICIQKEVSDKIARLISLQSKLNERYRMISRKNGFKDLLTPHRDKGKLDMEENIRVEANTLQKDK